MASKIIQPFRLGTKQIFLPKFGIALLRRGHDRPNFAAFRVPLRFNKFDLRDYLYNAYNVAVLNVRSHLKPRQPIRMKSNRVIRPLPMKIMTVELRQPFVWPEKPQDVTPWESKEEAIRFKAMKKKYNPQEELKKKGTLSLRDERRPDQEKIALRRHAEELLKAGSWHNDEALDPKFSDPKYNMAEDGSQASRKKTQKSKM
ncbi:hypothetical protein F5B19DRAFT_439327 [Rostrohypoxylon terebratum]|nr:hypothetical protein F5B19DRAFT_439327 [Rostrohypoxylon terebratum]